MALSIGKASLTLTANSEKLSAGLDAAGSKVKAYATKAKADANIDVKPGRWERLTSGLDDVYGKLSGFRAATQSAVGGLNGAALMGASKWAGPLAAGFVAAAGGAKLFGDAVGSIKDLAAVGRQADAIGIDAGDLQGLAAATKMSTDDIGKTLTKFTAKMASGGADVKAALGKINVNFADIQGLDATTQFLTIADGIKSITNPSEQAAAALKLFEEEGLKLLPALQKGGDGIEELMDKSLAMGTSLDARSMEAVQRAAQAMPKIEQAFTGVWNRVVVAMAPVIETVANVATKIVAKLQPAFDWVARAADAYFGMLGPILEEVIDGTGAALEWVGGLFTQLFDFGGSIPSIGESITGVFKTVGVGIGYAVDVVKAFGGALGLVASYAVEAFGKAVGVIGDVIELGAKLPDHLGGDMFKEAAKSVQGFGQRAEQTANDIRSWGNRQLDAFGSNAKGVNDWFDKLAIKKAEVTKTEPFKVMAQEVQQTFDKIKLGGALERGSKEEYSVRASWESQGVLNQVSEQKRTNQLLGESVNTQKAMYSALTALNAPSQFNG